MESIRTGVSPDLSDFDPDRGARWIVEQGFDYEKVENLTALIYLNIAALHHYPYNKLLFYLGKTMLYKLIQK